MLFFKVIVVVLACVMLYHVYKIQQFGTHLRRSREAGKAYDEAFVVLHRGNIACLGCITFVAVCVIELLVRISPDPYAVNPWLLGVHLVIDAAMIAVGALMLTRFTGKQYPQLHRRLAYSFGALFAGSLGTGTWMLVILPN